MKDERSPGSIFHVSIVVIFIEWLLIFTPLDEGRCPILDIRNFQLDWARSANELQRQRAINQCWQETMGVVRIIHRHSNVVKNIVQQDHSCIQQ